MEEGKGVKGHGQSILKDWRLEYCPDCHLAKISLRKGAGEQYVLHCDVSLNILNIELTRAFFPSFMVKSVKFSSRKGARPIRKMILISQEL